MPALVPFLLLAAAATAPATDPSERLQAYFEAEGAGAPKVAVDLGPRGSGRLFAVGTETCCGSGRPNGEWSLVVVPSDGAAAVRATTCSGLIGSVDEAARVGDLVITLSHQGGYDAAGSESYFPLWEWWTLDESNKGELTCRGLGEHMTGTERLPVKGDAHPDLAQLDALLSEGRLEEAHALAGYVLDAHYGFHMRMSSQMHVSGAREMLQGKLLAGAHVAAKRLHDAGKKREAALLVCRHLALPELGEDGAEEEGVLTGVSVRNDLAFFLERGNFIEEARPLLERVVEASPRRAVAWLNLGDVRAKSGDAAGARDAYQRYEALLPKAKRPPAAEPLASGEAQRCPTPPHFSAKEQSAALAKFLAAGGSPNRLGSYGTPLVTSLGGARDWPAVTTLVEGGATLGLQPLLLRDDLPPPLEAKLVAAGALRHAPWQSPGALGPFVEGLLEKRPAATALLTEAIDGAPRVTVKAVEAALQSKLVAPEVVERLLARLAKEDAVALARLHFHDYPLAARLLRHGRGALVDGLAALGLPLDAVLDDGRTLVDLARDAGDEALEKRLRARGVRSGAELLPETKDVARRHERLLSWWPEEVRRKTATVQAQLGSTPRRAAPER